MERTYIQLTVCFEPPFWVGVYERTCGRRYEVCKITFGAEPHDYEVYEFLLQHARSLRFSPCVRTDNRPADRPVNPKRLQRDIRRQLQNSSGIGTKAQQALQLQREQSKQERHVRTRAQREAEKQRQFDLRQAKKKQKHRGH
ncbi:MAG: YjdF family protein [Butyricicoccus sp.]